MRRFLTRLCTAPWTAGSGQLRVASGTIKQTLAPSTSRRSSSPRTNAGLVLAEQAVRPLIRAAPVAGAADRLIGP
jgi:hypothetical protein